jgi:hypothetical protein
MPLSRARAIRCSAVILALANAALDAAPLSAQAPAVARLRVQLPAYRSPVIMDTLAMPAEHDVPYAAAWAAAERVFYELKIATDKRDSAQGVLAATRYTKSSSMAGQPMSRFMNCGTGMTGPNADHYRINMAVAALLTPLSPTRTRIGVALAASGMNMQGASTDPVMCGSSGRLETDFLARFKKALASP